MQNTSNKAMPEYLRESLERTKNMSKAELDAEGLKYLNKIRAQLGAKPLDHFLPVDKYGHVIPEPPTPKPPLARRIREAWRVLQGK